LIGVPQTWEQTALAAVLAAGPDAALSHAPAAHLWTFVHQPSEALELTVPFPRAPRLKGVRIHRSVHFDDVDIAHRNGIPCTSFERTLCDCTTLLSEFQLGRVLDDGLRRSVASLRRLKRCAERLESGPGRHMSTIRSLLAQRGIGFHPGGSASELHVLDVVTRAGLPVPVQQHRVQVGTKAYVLDLAWPDRKAFAEYYGLAVHSGPSAVAYDNARITDLALAGWTPLIFTDASSDREIVEKVAGALFVDDCARTPA
jgi:hypothetical protein